MIRVAAIAVAWGAGVPAAAVAQHEHHRAPDSARVTLDLVTARAPRVTVELKSGATVVHTHGSAAAGGSVADLLRTVPGIELDADGRVGMRGSSSVLLLMNGRRTELSGDALAAFLRQMPAAALERVEAGTSASARLGADGTAGVVNLVFHEDESRRAGRRSLAGSVASDDHHMVSASAEIGGDVLRWDVAGSLSGIHPHTRTTTARWSVVPGDVPLHTMQTSRGREGHRLRSVEGGTALRPAPGTLLSLRGAYSHMEGEYRNNSAFTYTNAAGNSDAGATGSLLDHVIPSGRISALARFDRGRARFTTETRASYVNEDFSGAHDDTENGYRYMTTVMASRQHELAVRNDVTLRLSGVDADVGQESRFRRITTEHDLTHFSATVSQDFRDDTDVHAGFVTARRSIGGVRAEAGVRVEADRTRIVADSSSERSATRFFPSVSGEWTDARRALVYRAAYGRRINRPGAEMLNPFSMGGDDMDEIVGNASLRPEIADQLELGIEAHRPRVALQLTPFVRWTRDPIRQIKAATPSGGAATTLVNLARARAAGADGSVRAEPTDRTAVMLSGSVAHVESQSELWNSGGVHATARLTMDVRITGTTTVQLYAYRRSTQAIAQGEILPAFTSELAVTRRLSGDRGRVTLRLSDPLRSDRMEIRVADTDFTQQSRRRTARPLLSLFASWAVGESPREDEPVRRERPAGIS